MTTQPPKPDDKRTEPKPAIKTVRMPSDEEIKAAFAPYVTAVGTVAHASNYLQERLAELFVIASGADRPIALAMWYSISNDRRQRGLLRVAITASKEDRWLPRLPKARCDLLWLVKRGNEFGNHRNDAIHTPCSVFISEEGHGMGAAFFNGNPNALKLKGKEIVKEFELCADYADKLTRFAEKAQSALVSFDYPWPDRPLLPDLEQENSLQDQHPQSHPESR